MQDEEYYLELIQTYQIRIEILEERLNSELAAKDREIEIYKSQLSYFQKLVVTLSERPIINNTSSVN